MEQGILCVQLIHKNPPEITHGCGFDMKGKLLVTFTEGQVEALEAERSLVEKELRKPEHTDRMAENGIYSCDHGNRVHSPVLSRERRKFPQPGQLWTKGGMN